jgi:hypothetical protein
MTIIKYINNNDYCLFQKSKFYLHVLVFKNNDYYYYEKALSKNNNKTYIIASKFLKTKNFKIEEIKLNNYDILYKLNLTLLNDEKQDHYCFISETFGDENYNTFCVYKNKSKIDSYIGQKKSLTFLITYFDYKIFSIIKESEELLTTWKNIDNINIVAKEINNHFSNKEILIYKRYIKYLFMLYNKYEFKDLYVNFNLFSNAKYIQKNMIRFYQYYDNFLGELFVKIINKLNIRLKNKNIIFFNYFKYYFNFLILQDYLDKNKIQNENVIIHSCIFLVEHIKDFLDNKNNYIINPHIILKEKMLLFIDENISKDKIKYFLNQRKKMKNTLL